MNSYNENLHATVVASLQNLELERKQVESEANASMFTLYYAEGATIRATDNLDTAFGDMLKKNEVKEQAVDNSNISNNLLASATQANQYVKQSVTNTAVCAANIQAAANSIVRLAGDLGSIFSIVNAADFDSDIFNPAREARDLINNTAYAAEKASKLAMDASISTSEVSASTVLDKAKSTNDTMNNMLKVATADFDAAAQVVTNDNATRAAVSAKEKIAEGDFEDLSTDHKASVSAFGLANQELNLNLIAFPMKGLENTTFKVKFNRIRIPFDKNPNETNPLEEYYPVKEYSIIIVKDSQKTTFSIANAETIVQTGLPNQFVCVKLDGPKTSQVAMAKGIKVDLKEEEFGVKINYVAYNLIDSDGDPIQLGTKYVAFVLASYWEDYKKKLNTFDDFLSAPSWTFRMTNYLTPVDSKDIKIEKKRAPNFTKYVLPNSQTIIKDPDEPYWFTFTVKENSNYNVEYRCMFLPVAEPMTKGLLNEASFDAFIEEVKELEAISEKYDPDIAKLQQQIIESTIKMTPPTSAETESGGTKTGNTKKTGKNPDPAGSKKSAADESPQDQLNKLIAEKQAAIEQISVPHVSPIDFLFTEILAEQVLPGNYLSVNVPDDSQASLTPNKEIQYTLQIGFGPEATDNFGNQLMNGKSYIPVIVSFSAAVEKNRSSYSNAWSDYKQFCLPKPLPFFKYEANADQLTSKK